ncbi:MAG: DUF3667 domain-containing protein [Pseudomonadota bacterium]
MKRSVREVLHELVHGVLHLDGKFWRTLPMPVFRPGRLTRDYIEGKRARYVAPFGIFLFTIFAMYFTFAIVTPPTDGGADDVISGLNLPTDGRLTLPDAEAQLSELRANIADLESEMGTVTASEEIAAQVTAMVALQRVETALADAIEEAKAAETSNDAADPDAAPEPVMVDIDGTQLAKGFGAAISRSLAEVDLDKEDDDDSQWAWLNDRVRPLIDNPDYGIYRIKQSAYKFSFLLMPLSLPFVWLLFFWRRDLHLYDHTIFILYSLSFMSLLFIASWIAVSAGWMGWASFGVIVTTVPLAHMFIQLKGAYRLGVIGAAVRTVFLSTFAIVVLTLFAAIVLLLGAFI